MNAFAHYLFIANKIHRPLAKVNCAVLIMEGLFKKKIMVIFTKSGASSGKMIDIRKPPE